MHRRENMLAWLRRQREGLGRVVVVSFAAASLALSGAPCFAMAIASAGHATGAEPPAAHHNNGHHEHSSGHDHGAASEAHDHTGKPAPAHCPHCPLSGAMPGHTPSTGHSFCMAADDVADQTASSALPPFAKYVPLVATFETPLPLALRPPPSRFIGTLAPHRSTIALNVRHCVFLI